MITAATNRLRANRWTNCGCERSGVERCSNTEDDSSTYAQIELKLYIHAIRIRGDLRGNEILDLHLVRRGAPGPQSHHRFLEVHVQRLGHHRAENGLQQRPVDLLGQGVDADIFNAEAAVPEERLAG